MRSLEVWRSFSESNGYSLLTTTGASVTSYVDQGLSGNTTYYYQVRAVNQVGESGYSNTAQASTFLYTVALNFNDANDEGSPWNNTSKIPELNDRFGDLEDESGTNTGIGITITDNFDGENPLGMNTGNNSGVVPDNVMRSSYWLDFGNTGQLKVDGLNTSQGYNFVFFASRDGGGDRTTDYTINGTTVSLNASYNTQNTVQINNVSPNANGEVIIDITLGETAIFGYIGALIIQAYDQVGNARIVENGMLDNIEADKIGRVYPNPFTNKLTIPYTSSQSQTIDVSVFDMAGKELLRERHEMIQGSSSIELNSLENLIGKGIYLLKISADNLPAKTIKLLKE